MGSLSGKAAIVTGANGGIGGAVAAAFAAEGAIIGLLDLPSTGLAARAEKLGGEVLPVDVTDEAAVDAAVGAFAERHGRLDTLFTSAAVQLHGEDSAADTLDLAVWERTMSINLTGTFLCMKHAARRMLVQKSGTITLCGSPTGISGIAADYAAYSASKAGVHGLVRPSAIAWAPHGVRVNAIVPGATRTPLISELLDDEDYTKRLIAATPLGRLGEPDDITGLAVLLASDAGAFITGAILPADGGMTAR